MGSEILFATELRMYALCSFLAVSSWIAADRVLADYRFRAGLPMLALLIALGLIHGAATILISSVLLYVFPWGRADQLKRRLPTWFGFAAVVVVSLVPWIINGSVRKVAHTGQASVQALGNTIGGWVLGNTATLPLWAAPATAVGVLAALAAATALRPSLCRIVGSFVVWPLFFGVLLCVFVRPIWLERTFAFCAPFVALVIGVAAGHVMTSSRLATRKATLYTGLTVIAVASIAAGWLARVQAFTPHRTQFREAAAYLNMHAEPGDVIYVPMPVNFWGISRYLVGPTWGDMLKIQDPINPDLSKIWPRIYARLGPTMLKTLGLVPETRRLDTIRAPLFIGWSPLPELRTAKSAWLVVGSESDLAYLDLCPDRESSSIAFIGLIVYHIRCRAQE